MIKELNKFGKHEGFTLIELLIVIAIVGILAGIAIPGYLGMQERGRKAAVIRAANGAEAEVQAWLHSALKGLAGGTNIQGQLFEVDTDADGLVETDGSDANNYELGLALAGGTLCTSYVSAKFALQPETSPWATIAGSLWVAGAPSTGQISCSDALVGVTYSVRITALDASGQTIHEKSIYSD